MYAKGADSDTDEASSDTPLSYAEWAVRDEHHARAADEGQSCPETVLELLQIERPMHATRGNAADIEQLSPSCTSLWSCVQGVLRVTVKRTTA